MPFPTLWLPLTASAAVIAAAAQTPATPSAATPTTPSSPQTAAAPLPAPSVDAKAEALLARVAEKTAALKTLTADVSATTQSTSGEPKTTNEAKTEGKVRLLKPNFSYYEYQVAQKDKATGDWKPAAGPYVQASDGKKNWFVLQNKPYIARPLTADGRGVPTPAPQRGFFVPDFSFQKAVADARRDGKLISLKYLGSQPWDGADYEVVSYEIKDVLRNAPQTRTTTLYIGSDGLVHRTQDESTWNGSHTVQDTIVRNLRTDSPMTPAEFAYTPPAGAKSQEEIEASRPKLLAAGTVAPDFTVQDKDGKPVKLSDFRGKVVILDFWATWCGPCMASMPHTTEVAKQTADKGAIVLAVNVWDKKPDFDAWLPKHPEFASLFFAIDTATDGQDVARRLYNVTGIPTQYVIGRDGKIATSFLGYGGPTDALKNAVLKAAGSQP